MKKYCVLLVYIGISFLLTSCGSSENKENVSNESVVYGEAKAEVYYFHGDRRCATCNAIEELAKSFVADVYKDNKDVKFFAINFDKKENKVISEKFGITWSSLIIASGDKSIDLTVEAFQFAKTDPEYLKGEMKKIIDGFLK